jgi:hypothetical protein
MSLNRKQMIDEITMMANDMVPEFEEIKVKATHLDLPDEALEFPKELIKEGYEWLYTIWIGAFGAVRTVRNLLTPDQWERYKLWGSFDETQEMLLLKEKQVPFRKAIVGRNRPDLFKKGIQNVEVKSVHSKKGK